MDNKKFILISIDILLFVVIIFLGLQIKRIIFNKAKHVYTIKLDRQDYEFYANNNLKYFYEPEANTIKSDSPDWLGYSVINTLNNDTLNERYNYKINQTDNIFRIIAIGDSFTYGLGVNTTDNYPELLENILNSNISCDIWNKFEVINLGVPAYDFEYSVERFLLRGLKYNPNMIIWLLNNWNFQKLNEFIIPFEEKKRNERQTFDYLEAIKNQNEEIVEINLLKRTKDNFKKLLADYNERILIISFPSLEEKNQLLINDFFINLSPEKISYHKLADLEGKKGYVLSDKSHPNENAFKLISENLADYLLNNDLKSNCTYVK